MKSEKGSLSFFGKGKRPLFPGSRSAKIQRSFVVRTDCRRECRPSRRRELIQAGDHGLSIDKGRIETALRRLGFALLLAGFIVSSGCSKPLIQYTLDNPAQVAMPIQTAGIKDGRPRFREIFCKALTDRYRGNRGTFDCERYLIRLADEQAGTPQPIRPVVPLDRLRLFIVPGFLGDCTPAEILPFEIASVHLRSLGYRIDYIDVAGGGGSDFNAAEIAAFFDALPKSPGERWVLLGYSKGVADILHFLVNSPETAQRVDAVVSVSGSVNGSPLADDMSEFAIDFVRATSFSECKPGDGGGLSSIKRSVQLPWMAAHTLPSEIPYYSLASFTNRENISAILLPYYDKLAQVNPRNDSQMIFYDQIVPSSILLGFANGDHWALALPFTERAKVFANTIMNRNEFPRTALLESILQYVREDLAEPH
jgi:hypothetical protein